MLEHVDITYNIHYSVLVNVMKTQKVGNSLMITIPADLARDMGIKEGSEIKVEKIDSHIRLNPQPKDAPSILDSAGTIKIPNFKVKDAIRFIKEHGYDR